MKATGIVGAFDQRLLTMNGIVSDAVRLGAAMYGTTDQTVWSVTFVTHEMKSGRLLRTGENAYVLVGEYQLYFFQEHQVVHLSPLIARAVVHGPASKPSPM